MASGLFSEMAQAGRELFKLSRQNNDSNSFMQSIELLQSSLPYLSKPSEEYRLTLNSLGMALFMWSQQSGDQLALVQSITFQREGIELQPMGYPQHAELLSNLAVALRSWSDLSEDKQALIESITLFRLVLTIRPVGHPVRASVLQNLANALDSLWYRSFNPKVLDELITTRRELINLPSSIGDDRATLLAKLGYCLPIRYDQNKNAADLEEASELLYESLRLAPLGHPEHGTILLSFGGVLHLQFLILGDKQLLDESILRHREAVRVLNPGNSNYSGALTGLATSLHTYFELTGDRSALDEGTALARDAVKFGRHGTLYQVTPLTNLATILLTRFGVVGDPAILSEAVVAQRDALSLTPRGHYQRADILLNLANLLHRQFKELGDDAALEEAVFSSQESFNLSRPHDSRHILTAATLGEVILTFVRRTGDKIVLTKVIQQLRDALLLPSSSSDRASTLLALAKLLIEGFNHTSDKEALGEAVTLAEEALALRPSGSPRRPHALHALANARIYQFLYAGEGEKALHMALDLWHEVFQLRSPGHPDLHEAHYMIAQAYLADSPLFNWSQALEHLSYIVSDQAASVRRRLRLLIQSLDLAEKATARSSADYSKSEPILEVYTGAISLLQRAAHLGINVSTRLRELNGSDRLCRFAATRAIHLDRFSTAVELLEEGKAVFWSRALQLRSSALDALPPTDKERLTTIFRRLESEGFETQKIVDQANAERLAERRRKLSDEADELIKDIRSRPGFGRFLRLPEFERSQDAAKGGPIVFLYESYPGSTAVILSASGNKTVVLDKVDSERLVSLRIRAAGSDLRGSHNSEVDEDEILSLRALQISKPPKSLSPLAELWKEVVAPILKALDIPKGQGRERPHLYWCPFGNFAFLPLHAAGIYEGRNQVSISDFVVSSYIPSVSALIKAREGFTPIPREDLNALLIAETSAPGLPPLASVREEIETVAGMAMSVGAMIINDFEEDAHLQPVLEALPTAHVLHLCCHGQQSPDPLKSSFALHDGSMTIAELMKFNLPNAVLAFLSACETAKGDKNQPDQVVHLAASMLFCGFRSIVATMWSMHDFDGPQMARWFYESLLENETITLDDIAYALDDAVRQLRESGASANRWATFLHIGA